MNFKQWLINEEIYTNNTTNESWRANAAAALMGLGSSMGLVNAQSPTPTVNQAKQQEDRSPENIFKGYIVAIKEVIPINYIRMAQKNKEKFDKDYANLKNPTNDDIGFATNKEKFNKPIRMIIITDEAMNKKLGNAHAFATTDHKGSVIVMRKSSFIELPSKTSIGKLTPEGLENLAHELRHTIQDNSKVPQSRKQKLDSSYKHYMHDPREMGVRIAAIKNLISSKTISDYLGNDPVSQTIKMSLPQDEKQILNLILNNDLWEKQIIQNNPKLQQREIEQKINYIIERIKLLDSDADSLIDLYRSLNPQEKQNYIKEILQHYDKVVHNQPNLSYPQST